MKGTIKLGGNVILPDVDLDFCELQGSGREVGTWRATLSNSVATSEGFFTVSKAHDGLTLELEDGRSGSFVPDGVTYGMSGVTQHLQGTTPLKPRD